MKNFKIETDSTWKWADAVKRKEIWRPDEFIKTSTKEEALESAEFLLGKPQGLTYTITVKRDGEFFTYYRHSQPCLGSLVKYRDNHGPVFSRNPYFPRDIYVAFPEGEITYIGIHLQGLKQTAATPYFQFLFSKESPWIGAFNDKNSVIFKDNYLILTDMDTDPTIFYSLYRLGGMGYGNNLAKDWNPKADILLKKCPHDKNCFDPRRLAGQKPIKTSGGTWSQNWGYVRPYNESIFRTSLPCKVKDFDKLPTNQYPPAAPSSNEYFVSTMKEKFGVDLAQQPDKKIHDALVESWDFFKKEAGKLKEE